MDYISTKDHHLKLGFKKAVQSGLAPDGGLFVPVQIPLLNSQVVSHPDLLEDHELAFELLAPYVKDDLTEKELRSIISDTFQFEIPLKRIGTSDIYVLELFHGPTWAFKDIGARFLAGCLSIWSDEKEITILVATSGDTGGAIANAFYNQPGIRVIILYPSGKISPLQEQQIAGLGSNIKTVAINGSFDDCQSLVKKAFSDKEIRDTITMTSANSINIGRWLPQMVYYAIALKQAIKQNAEPVFSVPSGNYGNITAGILLHEMGLKSKRFISAHNANDTIPRFMQTGIYAPENTIPTYANAMDVSDPGNFVRLKYLWNRGELIDKELFTAISVPDKEIIEGIKECWEDHNYLIDPHTATAWKALNKNGGKGIILATAHPFKFEDVIIKALGYYPPAWKKEWKFGEIEKFEIDFEYEELKKCLI